LIVSSELTKPEYYNASKSHILDKMIQILWISLLQIVLVFSVSSFTVNRCHDGPSYWCQNSDTATECGVKAWCDIKNKKKLPTNEVVVTLDESREFAHVPVKIDLYYETFCPACRDFITGQLWQTFNKLKNSEIMEIGLYPYGNAEETKVGEKYQFECQHGEKECQMNIVETCALHLMPHPVQFMPFIQCVEQDPSLSNAEACAKQLQIEWNPILSCYKGSEGNYLQHGMAVKTEGLKPQHQYVPWIVVNGEHTEEMQDAASTNLLKFVCSKYVGVQPHVCRVALSAQDKCYKNKSD